MEQEGEGGFDSEEANCQDENEGEDEEQRSNSAGEQTTTEHVNSESPFEKQKGCSCKNTYKKFIIYYRKHERIRPLI